MPAPLNHLNYLRHRRGGGKLFDTSEACERTLLDRDSDACEKSSIWQSKITGCYIHSSVISDSVIKDSWIQNADIRGGVIERSAVSCELVQGNVCISDSRISGRSRIAHRAVCEKVSFKDLTVKGTAVLKDWPDEVFNGRRGYITRGVWTRPPRVVRLKFGVTITESVTDEHGHHAFVACFEFPIARWLRISDRYGRAQGWTTQQVDKVRQVLLDWQANPISASNFK